MSENDYVATATAEKRLREVLDARFDHELPDMANQMAEILLADAEITYLPRKKSVSITLRVPETAPTPKAANGSEPTVEQQHTAEYGAPPNGTDTPEASVPDESPYSRRGARFGVFEPTVTSAPEYHEDDYFVE